MIRQITRLSLGVIVAAGLLPATIATAAIKDWTDGTGIWSTPANWSGGTVPIGGDLVNIYFTDGVARTVTYDIPAITLGSINVSLKGFPGTANATLSMSANNLTVGTEYVGYDGRGTIDHSGGTHTIAAGSLNIGVLAGSTGTYNLSGTGALVVNAPVFMGDEGTGIFNQTGGTNLVTGAAGLRLGYTAGSNGTYNISGGSLTSNQILVGINGVGTLTIQSGGYVSTNDLAINSVSTVNLNGGTLNAGSVLQGLNVTNALSVNSGGKLILTDSTVNAGSLVNSGDLVAIDATIAGPLVNNSAVTVVGSVDFNGLVSGPGNFYGPGTPHFNAGLSPGSSPAIVTFEDSSIFGANNTLIMELGGTSPGSGHDQIVVSGELILGGELDVLILPGFTPSAGQAFNILDWGNLAGTFSSLTLPTLVGLTWNTSQLYTTGVLSVAAAGLPGDYNQNGAVDAADYALWRNNLGSGTSLPNDDTPGVGQDDYARWRAHFGQTAGSGAALPSAVPLSAAVPEPASLVLCVSSFWAISIFALRKPWRDRRHSPRRARNIV